MTTWCQQHSGLDHMEVETMSTWFQKHRLDHVEVGTMTTWCQQYRRLDHVEVGAAATWWISEETQGKGQSSATLKWALADWAWVQALGPCVQQPGKLVVFLQQLLAPWAVVSRLFFLLCRIITIWKLVFVRHLRIMFVRLLALIYKLKIYCFIHFFLLIKCFSQHHNV